MIPTVTLGIEQPPVERLGFHPELHTTFLVDTLVFALRPLSPAHRAELDHCKDMFLT